MSPESQLRMRRFFDLTSHLNVDAIKDLSDQIREGLEAAGRETDSLVYGEIAYSAMYELLEMLKDKGAIGGKAGEVFLDLGSGVGKAVLMAGFLHSFEACIGYEVLPELHTMALELFAKAREDTGTRLESRLGDNGGRAAGGYGGAVEFDLFDEGGVRFAGAEGCGEAGCKFPTRR